MFAIGFPLTLPITNPVLIFALAMVIFLVAPLVFERLRVPGIIGLILAGLAVGPHGFRLLDRGPVIDLLGTVGLVYLMFLAGVELDLQEFRRRRGRSALFGALTFALPLAGALAASLLMGYPLRTAVLLGAIFATQTLVAYPLVLRYGILRNEAVTVTVGATIITDVAVLLVLAVIAASSAGSLDLGFWVGLLVPLGIVAATVLFGLPAATRWFFRRTETGGAAEYVFVLAALFLSAFAAELAGVEPIIGAFLAGLALNPLIPDTSLLANRVRFVGEAIFIPFFLLSVGMLVDLGVFTSTLRAWMVMGVLLALAIALKWVAAQTARRIFRYSAIEGRLMFGLSVSHAAATMAVTLVGYRIGLFDELILNVVVLIILVTCLIGPAVVARAGRQVALHEERKPYEPSHAPQRVLVPLSNPATAPALMDLALLVREPGADQPIYVLTVVPEEGGGADEYVANAERMLSKAVAYAAGAGVNVQAVTRVDQNFARGLLRGMVETRTSTAITGWDGRSSRHWVFGSVLDRLLEQSTQQIVVAKLGHPLATTRRIVVMIPRGADHASGFDAAAELVKRIAGRLGASLHLLTVESPVEPYSARCGQMKPTVPISGRMVDGWSEALTVLRMELRREDLVVVMAARPDTVGWHSALQRLPARLATLVPESFLVVYAAERQEAAGQQPDGDLPRGLVRSRLIAALPGRAAYTALDALLERQYPRDMGRRRDILRALLHSPRGAVLEIRPGVVVAHARMDFLKEPELYLGRSPQGVVFAGAAGAAALVFLLLSPSDQPGEHLAVLADIARFMSDSTRAERLREAGTEDAMVEALRMGQPAARSSG
jgi:Kef-type K+ transport system membrane component KefB/mannitol/fructose-specific phosphotransferase system IIA component (Ntr-type)